MTERGITQYEPISRRAFCKSAVVAAAGLHFAGTFAVSQTSSKVKFYKNLGNGHIGVKGNQRQMLDYAVKYGFEGITPSLGEFEKKSAAEIAEWAATMKEKGIRYGSAGLPVEFRRDQERFRNDMAQFPKKAAVLKQMGVSRVATWILPGSNELTYLQNFEMHKTRFQEAAKVLGDNDIRLGLEFVGPRTSRARNRFPFACTQIDMMELVHAVGLPNVGLLLDSWHWYTSHGTIEEMLQLTNRDIVHVHVNDAPAGIPVDEQMDNKRALPVTTGVIDMKGFANALVKIGYDGPVECEPFDQELRKMDADAALQKTIDALNRMWALIEV